MRRRIHAKYQGHCAYCGKEIALKEMQIDHIIPKFRHSEKHGCLIVDGSKFTEYTVNDERNLNPSCRVCNKWKSIYSVDEFRHEIAMQITRLRQHSASFRLAEKFNQIRTTDQDVVFWFEKYKEG